MPTYRNDSSQIIVTHGESFSPGKNQTIGWYVVHPSLTLVSDDPIALYPYINKIKFFANPCCGYNMNIDLGFSGTPVLVHNGVDNVYWTASIISGTWVFDSTAQAHTGTKSIDATATIDEDVVQIAKGSTIDLSGYTAITGWIYISFWDDRGTKGIKLYGWNTSTSAIVGSEIDLRSYIDIGTTGAWQKFTIPLSEMDLSTETIDALRIKTIGVVPGPAPAYYLDDIQMEELGEPVEFNITPDEGTWLHVNTYALLLVDAYSPTLADSTMPYISYDKFLGVPSLTNGILYRRFIGGETPLAFPLRNLGDILLFPGAEIVSQGSDGTNTFLKLLVELREPIVLKPENGDKISFVVSDDLSGLLKCIISANCKEEIR